jgi:hypothetical protein
LTSDDQKRFGNEFVDSLPWNSFGRKNVGYLFAIAHGAKIIWDFDDDNYLKFWLNGASPDQKLVLNSFTDSNSKYYKIKNMYIIFLLRKMYLNLCKIF